MFQPENPHPNLPIKPYPVRKYHYSHNLCHGLLHNAVYCAVRTHDLSLAQLPKEKVEVLALMLGSLPFRARLWVTSAHRIFNCQSGASFLPPHFSSQDFEHFLNHFAKKVENYFFIFFNRLLMAYSEVPNMIAISHCLYPWERKTNICFVLWSPSSQSFWSLLSSNPNVRGSEE